MKAAQDYTVAGRKTISTILTVMGMGLIQIYVFNRNWLICRLIASLTY
jgi:NhaP-type Na+/H+ or K+/H+ antiporter